MSATGTAGLPSDAEEKPPSILAECTRIVIKRRRTGLLTHVIGAGSALWLAVTRGWGRCPSSSSASWWSTRRSASWVTRRFLARRRSETSIRRWAIALYFQLAGLGLLYNVLFVSLAREGVPHALDYLLLILAAYCAGGAARYQHLRGLAISFDSRRRRRRYAIRRFVSPDGGLIAIVVVAYMVFMSSTSLGLHREALERLRLTREVDAARLAAERLALTDGLTGLPNRRAFFSTGVLLFESARRHGRSLSVLMMDLDHFKSINDRLGHLAGDAALVAVAEALRGTKRATDMAGRLGGEEFALLLPETGSGEALGAAERLRCALGEVDWGSVIGSRGPITVSIGVAELSREDSTLDSLLERADRSLYRAKEEGRDRVVVEPEATR